LLIVYLTVIGTGLGLAMLTLLIAVQHAVPKPQLGIATSLNQFFRSIGGAMGVALLGAVLTAGLTSNLYQAASSPNAPLTREQARTLGENPSALVSPEAQHAISPRALAALQASLANSIRTVFAASGVMCIFALLFALFLPAGKVGAEEHGEDFVMAEMTVIDPEHEPQADVASDK
jgi:hypothetical protein